MPPTPKKLRGHNASGLSVRACVCASVRRACYIFGTLHGRVLKLHIWLRHPKLVDPYFFFLFELSFFLELCPFGENHKETLSAKDIRKNLSYGLKTLLPY